MTSKITIRPMVPEDLSFVIATWLNSFKDSDLCRRMTKGEYFKTYEPIVKDLIGQSETLIACLADDPDVILGYIVRYDETIHYCFVKDSWRKLGIFKMLLGNTTKGYFTHWTSPVNSLSNKYPDFIYNPFKLRSYDGPSEL